MENTEQTVTKRRHNAGQRITFEVFGTKGAGTVIESAPTRFGVGILVNTDEGYPAMVLARFASRAPVVREPKAAQPEPVLTDGTEVGAMEKVA